MTSGPKFMTCDPKVMTSHPKLLLGLKNAHKMTQILWQETQKLWQVTRKLSFYKATHFKITGPTGIYGENLEIKMVIREPFANNLALLLKRWTEFISILAFESAILCSVKYTLYSYFLQANYKITFGELEFLEYFSFSQF